MRKKDLAGTPLVRGVSQHDWLYKLASGKYVGLTMAILLLATSSTIYSTYIYFQKYDSLFLVMAVPVIFLVIAMSILILAKHINHGQSPE